MEDPVVPKPGCRYAAVKGVCEDGHCLVGGIWDVYDRCAQEKKKPRQIRPPAPPLAWKFVRYEASMPNGRGFHPGVFALANGLAKDGRLSAEDWASWRSANDHYNAAYADPSTVDGSVYDRATNPSAQSWFKRTAAHLVPGVEFYTDLLHRYGVGWRVLYSNDPGKVLYEDDVQVVVAPYVR